MCCINKNNKVSIIVPVYNTYRFLDKCFDSILSQTYKYIELIATDDGGRDDSVQKCDEYALDNDNFITIHKCNEGLSEARNDGIELCSGDHIAFVDSDDYILPNMYEDMVECKNKTGCDIVVCQWQWEDKEKTWTVKHSELDQSICGFKDSIEMEKLNFRGGYYDGLFCAPWNKLFSAEIFKTVRFYGRKYEDYRINDAIASKNYQYYVMKEFFYIYCESPVSLTRGNKFSCDDFLWLDVLIKRIELFSQNEFIVNKTRKLFCDCYLGLCISADKNGLFVPEKYHKKFRNILFSSLSEIKGTKRIKMLFYAFVPNVCNRVYVLKGKICQH